MYTIMIAGIQEFYKLKEQWNNLVYSMKRPSVFCTWEWMHIWIKYYGKDYRPIILLFYYNENIVGILPVAIKTMRIEDGVIPVRTLVLWSNTDLYPDHMDIIAAQEDAPCCIETFFYFIYNKFTEWDLVYFSHIDSDSQIYSSICDSRNHIRFDDQKVSVAPFIAVEEDHEYDFQNYLQALGRNRRHDLKRRTKKLIENDGIIYSPSNNMEFQSDIDRLFMLHERRAQSKDIITSFQGEKLISFHKELADIFAQNDWLRLRFLYNGDTSIAAVYIFSFANRWFAYQSGLDPQWESKGAGSVILYLAVMESFTERIREFDFLRGGEEYKNTWTKRGRDLVDVRIYNKTVRGTLFKDTYRFRSFIKRLIRKTGK